jgi:ATP-dependent 26S proteasome regulatory subunit
MLNVLDGVVDTPGRIIILTSNHPEKLDPALVRPGRINRKVHMGRVHAAEALQMVRHYFAGCGGVSEAQERRLRRVLVDGALSPAELESLCAEHDCAAELVSALAAHPALVQQGAALLSEVGFA